jgi:GT2 family glycosyltransferase
MLISRSLFDSLGGFCERYRSRYHDVDLCLRARELGRAVVCVPGPGAIRHELSAPREDMIDRALLVDSWFERLDRGDPYLNPRLSVAMT